MKARNDDGISQWPPSGSGATKPETPRYDARTFRREDGATPFLNRFAVGLGGAYSTEKAQRIADHHDAALQNEMEVLGMVILLTNFNTREEHEQFLLELTSNPDVRSTAADRQADGAAN